MSFDSLLQRKTGERFYHPELDVLRFFSFLMIFVQHSMSHDPAFYAPMGLPPALVTFLCKFVAATAFGVPMFFLLSSYLVTELLLRERSLRSTIDLRAFFVRRILRMWPLYLVFLAMAWTMQYFVPGQHIGWQAMLAFLCLAGNWWIVFVGFPSSVIFPLWSVSVEEQFYLVWPALLRRLRARGILISALTLLVVANLTRFYLALHNTWESRLWCNTFVQLDGIAFGILMALFLKGEAPRFTRGQRLTLFAAGALCFVLAGDYFRIKFDPLTTSRVMLGYPIADLGTLAWLLSILRPQNATVVAVSFWARLWQMVKPRLISLGRLSYGLYVFHVLGLTICDFAFPNHTRSVARFVLHHCVALAVAIVCAMASFRWLESPFLKLKQRFTHVPSRPASLTAVT